MNREIINKIINYQGQEKRLALATVISKTGSAPRGIGAQMLVYPDGNINGTIGGGAIEGKVIKKARKLAKEGKVKKYHFEMTNQQVAKDGGVCGGTVDVLIESIYL